MLTLCFSLWHVYIASCSLVYSYNFGDGVYSRGDNHHRETLRTSCIVIFVNIGGGGVGVHSRSEKPDSIKYVAGCWQAKFGDVWVF